MNKKYIYILIPIILILILPFVIKKDTKTFKVDGVNYAVSIDGNKENKFPNKGSYNVNIECSNAKASWNYQEWVAEIYNITGKVSCDITFTSKPKITMANYIKNLLGTKASVVSTKNPSNPDNSILKKTSDNGEDDYRYRGSDPNNYILFNNELWRIIGVFDENTHSIEDTHLVKIIRNFPITRALYAKSISYFPDSDLHEILTSYYNCDDAREKIYCNRFSEETTNDYKGPNNVNCDFRNKCIKNKEMVEENANWFIGGNSKSQISSASKMYFGEKNYTYVPKYGSNPNPWALSTKEANITLPVGVMYASDFLYAFPLECGNNCLSLEWLNQNWLNMNLIEWTMTINTESTTLVYGLFYHIPQSLAGFTFESNEVANNYYEKANIRPTLYLKSNVYYISGTGTQADPYIIDI